MPETPSFLDLIEPNAPTILMVDDEEINLMILEEMLQDHCHILKAFNGKQALEVLAGMKEPPKIILLDVIMPEMNGRQLFEILMLDRKYKHIPVIFITGDSESEGGLLSAGAADFIHKPFPSPLVVRHRIQNQIELKAYKTEMEQLVYDKTEEVIRKTEEAKSTLNGVLQGLANVIEIRDSDSGEHVTRTQLYVGALAKHLIESGSKYADELVKMEPETIEKSMALHDVGKIAIPDSILNKPGPLTDEERETMKTHTTHGKEIIGTLGDVDTSLYLKHCEDICYGHHERWDGKGYPRGLKEDDIPLAARLAAIADVYDALVSARVYKAAMTYADAIGIMIGGRGTQFDALLIDAMLQIQDEFSNIARIYA